MPLPTPRLSGDSPESQKEFISRCAGSAIMNKDYPKNDQRVAVCFSLYRQAVKKKRANGEDDMEDEECDCGKPDCDCGNGGPNWDETEAQIVKAGFIETENEVRLIIPENLAAIPSAPQGAKQAI